MTFPYTVGQCPIYYNHMRTGRPVKNPKEITDKVYCSRYLDSPVDPLYVFGHGLSYNTYTYDHLTLSSDVMTPDKPIEVTVTVKNEGAYTGKEIVQLYIHDMVASVVRPVKELRNYAKIELKPGECVPVTFTLTVKDLAFHTASGEFAEERGQFEVYVGKNSDDCLSATFRFEK